MVKKILLTGRPMIAVVATVLAMTDSGQADTPVPIDVAGTQTLEAENSEISDRSRAVQPLEGDITAPPRSTMTAAILLPAAVLLIGTALAGLGVAHRRKKRSVA